MCKVVLCDLSLCRHAWVSEWPLYLGLLLGFASSANSSGVGNTIGVFGFAALISSATVGFLCGAAADNITGSTISLDGGWTAR